MNVAASPQVRAPPREAIDAECSLCARRAAGDAPGARRAAWNGEETPHTARSVFPGFGTLTIIE